MQLKKRATINRKLTRLVTAAVATALALAYVAFVVNQLRVGRQNLVDQMSAMAEVLAWNAAATITFDDGDAARQVLETLQPERSVESACIFATDGQRFATYVQRGSESPELPNVAPPQGLHFGSDGHLSVAKPILVDGEQIGTFFLHATNDHAYRQFVNYSLSMGLVLLVSFLAAQLLTSRMQRAISSPILKLAHAAEQVSAAQDYSIRVAKTSDDEIGALVDEFNHMLEQIDVGKRALQAAHEHLARQSEERMRAIVETAADGIVTISTDGTIESCNSAACELFQVTTDELVGGSFNAHFSGLSEVAWRTFVDQQLHGSGSQKRGAPQYEALRRDGTRIPLLVSLSEFSIDVDADSAKAYTAILRDLSEFQRLQMELAEAQKLESIGQLSAGIAHEINTPMQFISDNIGFLRDSFGEFNALLDKYEELLQPAQPPASWETRYQEVKAAKQATRFDFNRAQISLAIDESQQGIDRIIQIVRAMKQFSHFGSHTMVSLDLNDAICSTATITRNRWKYSAELELALEPNLPSIICFSSEINQVLLNLVVNAADAIVEKLGSEPEHRGKIVVRTSSSAEYVQIEVEDSGCGIPEQIRHRLFDPFFTTKEVGMGTGQGLAIAHDVVVNMHHGTIQVRSTPGEGTTFVIRLPLQQNSAPEVAGSGDMPAVVTLDTTAASGEGVIF